MGSIGEYLAQFPDDLVMRRAAEAHELRKQPHYQPRFKSNRTKGGRMSLQSIETNQYQAVLRGSCRQIPHILTTYRNEVEAAEANVMVPPEGKAHLKEEAYKKATVALQEHALKAANAAEIARKDLATVKDEHRYKSDPTTVQANWQRVQRLLDSGVEVLDIIQDAKETGDMAALAAVRNEYRSYEWGRTKDRKTASEAADRLNPVLDDAELPHADGSYQAAHNLTQELDKGLSHFQTALSMARAEIDRGTPMTTFPDWDGQLINPS